MQTSLHSICAKATATFLLLFIFYYNTYAQSDTLTNVNFDNSILKSGCSRFIGNVFSLPKGKMIYAGLYILNGHVAYGLKKDFSIEAGVYRLPHNDYVLIAGVKCKKSFYLTDHLAVALKPAILVNRFITTGFLEGILSYEIKKATYLFLTLAYTILDPVLIAAATFTASKVLCMAFQLSAGY